MESKILEEIQKHYKQEVIDFNWEPVQKQPEDMEFLSHHRLHCFPTRYLSDGSWSFYVALSDCRGHPVLWGNFLCQWDHWGV